MLTVATFLSIIFLSHPSVHSPQGECFKIQRLPLPWPRSPAAESSNSVLEHKGPQPAPDSAALPPADPSPPSLCLMPFAPVILNHFRFSLFPRAFDTSWTFGIIRPPLFISPRKPSLTPRSSYGPLHCPSPGPKCALIAATARDPNLCLPPGVSASLLRWALWEGHCISLTSFGHTAQRELATVSSGTWWWM